jgi:hypothetical protein
LLFSPSPDCSNELKSQLYRNFGKLYASQGRFNDALKQLALDVYYSSLESGPEHIDTAGGYFYLADVFLTQGIIENALALYDKVVDVWSVSVHTDLSNASLCVEILFSFFVLLDFTALRYKFLANLRHRPDESISDYLSESHIGEAVEMLRSILETRKKHLGANHIATGEAAYALGILKHVTGFDLDARNHYTQALTIYTNQLGAENESTIAIQRAIDDLPPVPQQLLLKQQQGLEAQRQLAESLKEQQRHQATLDEQTLVVHQEHGALPKADPTKPQEEHSHDHDHHDHADDADDAPAQPPSQLAEQLQQHLEALKMEQDAAELRGEEEDGGEAANENEERQEEQPLDDYTAQDAGAPDSHRSEAEAEEEAPASGGEEQQEEEAQEEEEEK